MPLPAVTIPLGDNSALLSGAVAHLEPQLLRGISSIAAQAPFRHMRVPSGAEMSVAMTNCGDYGWVTDARGYRYSEVDPQSQRPWPTPPPAWWPLAGELAAQAGFAGFVPDSCLINRYEPTAKMGLHQDRDESTLQWPIVSISLGMVGRFAFGGLERAEIPRRFDLESGDVVVWGGCDRLRFHGIDRIKGHEHPLFGPYRYNLTFRRSH